jgi:hypothetical protein
LGILGLQEQFGNLNNDLFAVTKDNGIEKLGHRLGIERTGTAAQNQGMSLDRASAAKSGMSGQIEDGEDIGVAEFIGQGDTEDIVGGQAGLGLQRKKRHALDRAALFPYRYPAHSSDGPLPDLVIEDMVEDLQALVGHADFIEVGKNQTKFQIVGIQAAVYYI